MLAHPLVNSMVVGLSIDVSLREQMPRILARYRYNIMAKRFIIRYEDNARMDSLNSHGCRGSRWRIEQGLLYS